MKDTITSLSPRVLANKIYEFVRIKSYAYTICSLDIKKMKAKRLSYDIKLKDRINPDRKPIGKYNYIKETGEYYKAYEREPVLVIYVYSNCRLAVCMTTNKKLIIIRYSDIVYAKS